MLNVYINCSYSHLLNIHFLILKSLFVHGKHINDSTTHYILTNLANLTWNLQRKVGTVQVWALKLCRQQHRETGDGKCYLTILPITEVIQHWWQMNRGMNMKGRWRDADGVKTKVIGEKPVPLPLSTTNPTCAGPRLNLGLHRDRLVTKCEDHLPSGTSSQVTTRVIPWHTCLETNLPYNPQSSTGN